MKLNIQESISNLTTMDNDQQLDLPLDIVSFILLRLPTKCLSRFKCVSKTWLSLISSPDFTKQHLNTSKSNSKIMWSVKGKYMDSFPLSNLLSTDSVEPRTVKNVSVDAKFKKGAKIVGSVNGLLCVFVPPKLLILWNPSVKKRNVVADSGVPSEFDKRSFGFGYDKASDDYKIVGFFGSAESRYDLFPIVKVFSFKTGEWKRIKSHKVATCVYEQNEPEISFAKGKFYWINTGVGKGDSNWAVQCLDLATEKYQSFGIPLNEMRLNCTMAVSEEGFVYVIGCRDRESFVWVMKEEDNWTKVCKIEYAKVDLQPNAMFVFNCHLFCVLGSGEIVMRHIDTFLIYNPKEGSMKFCYVECPGNGIDYEASNFVESLVWV